MATSVTPRQQVKSLARFRSPAEATNHGPGCLVCGRPDSQLCWLRPSTQSLLILGSIIPYVLCDECYQANIDDLVVDSKLLMVDGALVDGLRYNREH